MTGAATLVRSWSSICSRRGGLHRTGVEDGRVVDQCVQAVAVELVLDRLHGSGDAGGGRDVDGDRDDLGADRCAVLSGAGEHPVALVGEPFGHDGAEPAGGPGDEHGGSGSGGGHGRSSRVGVDDPFGVTADVTA